MKKCSKCQSTVPCGCGDTPLTTYSTSPTCPTPQVCSEFTYTGCIIYNGPELTDVCISPGMSLNEVIQALVLLNTNPDCVTTICPIHAPYINVITSTTTTISLSWGSITDALSFTVSYQEEGASPSVWTDVTMSPSTLNYIITGLTCGTNYLIKVSVSYGAGPSSCESLTIRVATSDC